jgi:hypothetical protein
MNNKPGDHYPSDMDTFLVRLEQSYASLMSIVDEHSEKELTEKKDAAGWTAKDHLYHLAVWVRGVRFVLQGRPLYEGVELTEEQYRNLDVDSQNAVVVEANRQRSIEDVMQVLRTEHQYLVDHLASPETTWHDLQKPFSHYAPTDSLEEGDAPVLVFVFGDTVDHFRMHQEWIAEILRDD